MLAGSAGRTLAHVSSLRQNVAGGSVLAGLADARIERLLAVSAGELRRTYASVVRRLVLLHRVIVVIVIVLVLKLVIVVALFGGAAFFRVLLRLLLIDRRAMIALASHDVHTLAATVTATVSVLAPLLQSSALTAVAQVLLEDRLTRRAVLAGQIGARVVAAFLHAVTLENVLVVTDVEIDADPVYLQLANATEEPVIGADIVVHSVKQFVILKKKKKLKVLIALFVNGLEYNYLV